LALLIGKTLFLSSIGYLDKAQEVCEQALEALFKPERLGIVLNTQRLNERELLKEIMNPI
jgi:hypothetical protein